MPARPAVFEFTMFGNSDLEVACLIGEKNKVPLKLRSDKE